MGEMLVANSFDLWQKDAFFSAAEEIQQSTDIMESAYRTWLKAKREGLMPQHLDELGRELQMALGTAKWQLDEFERAVCLSYRKNSDAVTITRHRQFVSAMEHQISRVENSLRESLYIEGKKPFRWVDLDDEECHDLAIFLSGTPGASERRIKGESLKHGAVVTNSTKRCDTEEVCSLGSNNSSEIQIPNQGKSSGLMKLKASEILEARDEISHQTDQVTSNRRVWNSAGRSALEIVIDDNNARQKDVLIEATPKEKGSKPSRWSLIGECYHGGKGTRSHTQMKMVNWINQLLRGDHRSQRQQQVSPVLFINSRRYLLCLICSTQPKPVLKPLTMSSIKRYFQTPKSMLKPLTRSSVRGSSSIFA